MNKLTISSLLVFFFFFICMVCTVLLSFVSDAFYRCVDMHLFDAVWYFLLLFLNVNVNDDDDDDDDVEDDAIDSIG